ncbi:MAG TPA: H-NS histone family protein, partial [Caldimonas sp.]|nr:H-NS histone family protein [Caldimonas sp.]
PAKYTDGSGRTWSGRGRRPGWVNEALAQGKPLQSLAL